MGGKRKIYGRPVAGSPGLRVGTSGWSYGGWDQVFYPAGVKSTTDRLAFYSKHFATVEVNYSFYHLPKPEPFQRWAESVQAEFLFAIKASRFITLIKKLKDIEEAWTRFLLNPRTLGKRLGPILFQFPPSFRADSERLSEFLGLVRHESTSPPVWPVFEFRHPFAI